MKFDFKKIDFSFLNKKINNKNNSKNIKIISLSKLQKYLYTFFSKDKDAKKVLKQSERGILLIMGSLLAGYITYSLLYQSSVKEHQTVQETYSNSERRRLEIQTHLDNQSSLVKSIENQEKKLSNYKIKYPNYLTDNEILKVIEEILAKEHVSPATFTKGDTKMAQKSIMNTFITNKGIGDLMKDKSYFGSTQDGDGKSQNGSSNSTSANDGTTVQENDKSNFEFTEVSFSVNDISQQRGLNIMNSFSKYERIIIPESWKLIGGDDNNYRLEATVLFFAYRDSDNFDSLF